MNAVMAAKSVPSSVFEGISQQYVQQSSWKGLGLGVYMMEQLLFLSFKS